MTFFKSVFSYQRISSWIIKTSQGLFCFGILVSSLLAEPPKVPAAGIVERQLEEEYEQTPLQPDRDVPFIKLEIPEEKLEIPEGIKVKISKVDLLNNNILSEKELFKCLQPYLGKDLNLKEIYSLCFKIESLYASKGYFLARVYPPVQEISKGVLVLEVLEGCLGEITVEGNKFYTKKFIESYFSYLQAKPVCESQFFKALMLLNENTDLKANVIFEKGKKLGCADVIINVQDSKPMHLSLNANNYGRDLTTNFRAGGRFDYGNILFQGDRISLTEVVGFPFNALYFTDARYNALLNRIGTSLQLNYLFSKFKVEEQMQLQMRGLSNIATLKINQAFIRTRRWNFDTFFSFDYKQIENFTLDDLSSFDKLRVLSLGCLLDHVNSGFSRDLLNVTFAAGIPNFLGGLKSVDTLSSRKGGGGRFFVFNADYDRIQFLPKKCFLYIHASTQLSPSKLTVPEQIFIGGYGTVRGFPFSVATGDSGYYVNLELRTPVPFLGDRRFFWFKKTWDEVFQFDIFCDTGGVFWKTLNDSFLSGTGFGFRLNHLWGIDLSFDVGFPLNNAHLAKGTFYYLKIISQPF